MGYKFSGKKEAEAGRPAGMVKFQEKWRAATEFRRAAV